jgi:hypothetical protein
LVVFQTLLYNVTVFPSAVNVSALFLLLALWHSRSVHRGRCHGKPHKPPKRRTKSVLFGEKKHALKIRVIIERNSKKIPGVQEAKDRVHDFKVYKDNIESSVSNSIGLDADLGYLGIEEYHANSCIPIKNAVLSNLRFAGFSLKSGKSQRLKPDPKPCAVHPHHMFGNTRQPSPKPSPVETP